MRYTVTAALPYTNGPIHIGHLAGVYLPADIFVRYLRQNDKEVIYICGSDEHGVAISMKSLKENIKPQEVIDKYHKIIKNAFSDFGISFDHYARTSDKTHHKTASNFFQSLYEQGIFEEKTTEQLYDKEAQQFLADRFVTGSCPKCGYSEAYGDQCEQCGSSLNATDLINPKSTISGLAPITKTTKHWFLPLAKYSTFLKDWLASHKSSWKPNVYAQVKGWLDEGLKSRAVTRDLDWGIPVPVADADGKVLYVWFDAPIGYISSTKEWAVKQKKPWQPYWKDKDTKLIHFIGKDNIVFHCIIFPAMLHAHGGYILPENVPANEFLNLEGQKLSTSKNWAVWLHEYIEDFPNKQDVLRYVLISIMPETKDSDFTWKDFQAKNNNELVAIYGNFFNRVTVLTHKYYKGIVPKPHQLSEEDQYIQSRLKKSHREIGNSLEVYRFREACREMMNIARMGNKYLADHEPWKVINQDPERVQTIMYITLQIAATLAILSKPFLPFTADKMLHILGIDGLPKWNTSENIPILTAGHCINPTHLLFEKIDDDLIDKQIDRLKQSTQIDMTPSHPDLPPQKPEVSFEQFSELDLRIGTIISADKMPKTDKLLIIKLDTGTDIRTVISGIAEYYQPSEIVGKQVCFVANLAPRKLRGIESQGMILTSITEKGQLSLISPNRLGVVNGQSIN